MAGHSRPEWLEGGWLAGLLTAWLEGSLK